MAHMPLVATYNSQLFKAVENKELTQSIQTRVMFLMSIWLQQKLSNQAHNVMQ
jgi:hypothetical protein